jgi:glyoxylase-like metal-dependent hydrolase (beta-lactamase superfamily II)
MGMTAQMQITSEIYQVGGGGLTSMGDAAVYLINFGGHGALVDAGCGPSQDRLFKNVAVCGSRPEAIEYLLITHCHYDHTGGAEGVKERTGCQIIAHELDAAFLERGDDQVTAAKWYGATLHPFQVDRKLSLEEERISLGNRDISAIHTPGHSPGSVVYVVQSDGLKVLFGQDVHGPLDASLLSDREQYGQSLARLLSMEADILCEGHYGVFKGKKAVKDFIRSFLPSAS